MLRKLVYKIDEIPIVNFARFSYKIYLFTMYLYGTILWLRFYLKQKKTI